MRRYDRGCTEGNVDGPATDQAIGTYWGRQRSCDSPAKHLVRVLAPSSECACRQTPCWTRRLATGALRPFDPLGFRAGVSAAGGKDRLPNRSPVRVDGRPAAVGDLVISQRGNTCCPRSSRALARDILGSRGRSTSSTARVRIRRARPRTGPAARRSERTRCLRRLGHAMSCSRRILVITVGFHRRNKTKRNHLTSRWTYNISDGNILSIVTRRRGTLLNGYGAEDPAE